MHQSDANAENRSIKLAGFLCSLEGYVNEIVTSNHGIKPEEMSKIVTESFMRSVQANVQYHDELAHLKEKEGESVNADYHSAMAQVYRSLLK